MRVLWFRRDLRLTDNAAVAKAVADGAAVLPCFVVDPWFYTQPDISAHRVRFLFEALADLDRNLRDRGSRLWIFHGDTVAILQEVTRQLLAQGYRPALCANYDVQVEYGVDRDRALGEFYRAQNLQCHWSLDNFVQVDGERRSQWRDEYYRFLRQDLYPVPVRIHTPELDLVVPQLSVDDLPRAYARFWEAGSDFFRGGETQAQATLRSFLQHRYRGYHWKISRPWLTQRGATSHLSPHLTWGTVSVRQVYRATKTRGAELSQEPKAERSLKQFRARLRWRDSANQRLFHNPAAIHHNFYPEFDEIYTDEPLSGQKLDWFRAWQEGRTGYVLVDASMRQLAQIGWMNFRMRAMCVTFLVVNCGIAWQHGARHYMNYLVDGDLAIDHWQWQAQAGVTNPCVKTFRIYNPTKNLQEKDPDLEFVRYWLPELRDFSMPELLGGSYLGRADYPAPILDWKQTRRVNGKRISDLRQRVRDRLQTDGGTEYQRALKAKETVEKFWEANRERRPPQHEQLRLFT